MSELQDLAGLHMLDAVDFENISVPAYEGASYNEDSQCCRFRLDGTVWVAAEDPSDGYRSSMRELSCAPDGAEMKNTFSPVQVMAVYRNSRNGGASDLLELVDCKSGRVVLTVGTDNTDDYYPYFVAEWSPDGLSHNTAEPSP